MAGRQRRSTGKMSSSFYLFWTRIKRRKKAAHEVHLLAHFNTATNKKCLHWQQIIGRIDAHVAITPEESPAIVTGLLDFFHNQGKKTHISWRFLNEKSSQEKWQITYRSNDKPRPKRGSIRHSLSNARSLPPRKLPTCLPSLTHNGNGSQPTLPASARCVGLPLLSTGACPNSVAAAAANSPCLAYAQSGPEAMNDFGILGIDPLAYLGC